MVTGGTEGEGKNDHYLYMKRPTGFVRTLEELRKRVAQETGESPYAEGNGENGMRRRFQTTFEDTLAAYEIWRDRRRNASLLSRKKSIQIEIKEERMKSFEEMSLEESIWICMKLEIERKRRPYVWWRRTGESVSRMSTSS